MINTVAVVATGSQIKVFDMNGNLLDEALIE